MSDHISGQIRLMPPQVYEMDRLMNVDTESKLQQCILLRQQFGIERYFPVIVGNTDGFVSLLPGKLETYCCFKLHANYSIFYI